MAETDGTGRPSIVDRITDARCEHLAVPHLDGWWCRLCNRRIGAGGTCGGCSRCSGTGTWCSR